MGLFDFFGKDTTDAKILKKQVQLVLDKHARSPDRMQALQDLRGAITEAVMGMLRRFDMAYDKSIEDEQEKEWVFETLVGLGTGILPEILTYAKQASSLSWPLKIVGLVSTQAQLVEVAQTLCEQHNNEYTRDPSKKVQLVAFMGEHPSVEMTTLLLPYLQDMDEGVRFATIESLLRQATTQEAEEALVNQLVSAEEPSRRIKTRIVEGLAQWQSPLRHRVEEVEKILVEILPQAKLDAKKRIHVTKEKH